ncbi:S-adenosyl-L-methionine-dependent methyltransferase [Lentinula aciculospora]|uniref:S-adenosyl-L-methionine-dependent methyltransferase n=1 Tax=Lentinula aciculospora TaxID=153920 RepID=A0A9W9DKG1_9AGAR|nr:S-adenosyl-L-methionine-dependent methyltransferase [Lentinula aciculospora]
MATPRSIGKLAAITKVYITDQFLSLVLRLNLQNQLLTREVCDGKLIFAPAELEHGDQVLESGTGTGIWLVSLAEATLPTISFTGIDIHTHLFPQEFPSNISFLQRSVTDLPVEWTERFKIVNQRLLIGGLTQKEWKKALQEIHRVLVPGGWFQCIEPNIPSKTDVGPHTEQMFGVLRSLLFRNGLLHDIVEVLGRRLPKIGFVNVQTHTVSLSAYRHGEDFDHRTLMEWFFVALKPGMLAANLLHSEEEFEGLMQSMLKEWDESPHVAWSWSVIYAQKKENVATHKFCIYM